MLSFSRVLSVSCFALFLAAPIMAGAEVQESDQGSVTSVQSSPGPGSQKSIEEIAREMTNPLAAFLRLGYEGVHQNYQGSMPGADDQSIWSHFFQFSIPFRERNGKGWLFRFALPYVSDQPIYWADRGYPEWLIRQEDPTDQVGGYWGTTHAHTDDLSFDLVFGGVNESGRILNYGISGVLPTSSDTSNGKQQLILGPSINIGKMANWGTYGVLASQIFDVVEKRDKGTPDTNQTTLQGYFSYELGQGWQLISNPVVTYDWEGDSGNRLNLPVGGGIAKTFKISQIPLRLTAEVQFFVASTDRFGPDWLYKFSLSPIIPSKHTRH